ncbi:transporter substrate-binding domain-containing protein [Sporosarcina luteola]|uniref:transporter substrate-binding domain-containing protein n=1 Tax=Sporosarcina luteola TaxID=582850 RepID=UPI00203EA08C|nr:transporter substrate-binding domain-containing protein [Sporosarcina luteola]MCM3743528.1 transporter substrate-binding domain-containing protein [Sporosarcina luteola]
MGKRLISFTLCIFVLIFLVACSNDDKTKAESDGDKNVRIIKVATGHTSKPLSWIDKDGEVTGYEPEIIKELDKVIDGYKFELVAVEDSAGETGLATGKYDMLAGGLGFTEERAEQYIIPSESNGRALIKIYVGKDSGIEGIEDLVGKNISPLSPAGATLKTVKDWEAEHPEHKLKYDLADVGIPMADRLKEISNGKYDALFYPSSYGQIKIIEDQKLAVRATDPIKIIPTFFMIHKSEENEKLKEAIDEGLKKLKDSGKLSELSVEFYDEDVFQYDK